MSIQYADRIQNVPRSFIREILKVASKKDVISFAGGLPNPNLFPIKELQDATQQVFLKHGANSLQYSNSEGYIELRNYIAKQYTHKGINVSTNQIIITSGSQQALDLLGKIFINENDYVIMEEPGYLGAIQAFSMYRPNFISVPFLEDGIDCSILKRKLYEHTPKFIYTVPNFQNPSGLSYSAENRANVASLLDNVNTFIIEDNPYGELRFKGEVKPDFIKYLPNKTIMLGTFSKIVVPSFRLGWIVAPQDVIEKIIVAKQAADLHTNYFCQLVLSEYFSKYNNEIHIQKVSRAYGNQCNAMITAIEKYFPDTVKFTKPEGGMFLWATLPEGFSSMKLLEETTQKNVVFVPGNQFYTNRTGDVNTFRLNFSCSDEETIEKGIKIIGEAIQKLIHSK
jgi:2-aminoadipate transaminase